MISPARVPGRTGGLPDPAARTDPAAARRAFRETYDALVRRVGALLALPPEMPGPVELAARAQAVHDRARA